MMPLPRVQLTTLTLTNGQMGPRMHVGPDRLDSLTCLAPASAKLTGLADDLSYLQNPIWWAGMVTSKSSPFPATQTQYLMLTLQ